MIMWLIRNNVAIKDETGGGPGNISEKCLQQRLETLVGVFSKVTVCSICIKKGNSHVSRVLISNIPN